LKKKKQIHLQIWLEEGKLNFESLFLPHLQKHEGRKYQSNTRGTVAMLKGKSITLRGNKEVLAI